MIFFWLFYFFFKQKTAYEMRISDWSSDVCSSDLCRHIHIQTEPDRRDRHCSTLLYRRSLAASQVQAPDTMIELLIQFIRVFATLSILTIGGGQSIIHDIQQQSVVVAKRKDGQERVMDSLV